MLAEVGRGWRMRAIQALLVCSIGLYGATLAQASSESRSKQTCLDRWRAERDAMSPTACNGTSRCPRDESYAWRTAETLNDRYDAGRLHPTCRRKHIGTG